MAIFIVRLLLPMDVSEKLEALSCDHILSFGQFLDPKVTGFYKVEVFVQEKNLDVLKGIINALDINTETLILEEVDQSIDWLTESYQGFPPLDIGEFHIHGSHEKAVKTNQPNVICVDAATAFGSGEHGTTKGCLLAMQRLCRSGFDPEIVLDLGCGSGILALGVACLWTASEVWAVDNDEEAVRVTKKHVLFNKKDVKVFLSEGFQSYQLSGKRFDLIVANILAEPLCFLAEAITQHSTDNAFVILSGILDKQAAAVKGEYEKNGFALSNETSFEGWTTLVVRRG